jgi:hypothetical protein
MANDLPPLPNELIEAIGAYWDTGYEEGKCGIGGDAANECLAAVYERVRDYARAAVLAEREANAKLCDSQARQSGDAMTFYTATGQCAAAIRARSTP